MGPYVLTAPGLVQLHTAATTGDGNILLMRGECRQLTVFFQSTGTTSGGALSIEEAYYDTNGPVYGGTWSVIAAVNASTFTGGAQIVYHIASSSVWAVRVRISSTITGGGTVSVWAEGN
jgi:hypothetical protein